MADRFESELKAVHGEVIRCTAMDDAQKHLAELVKQAGWTKIGVMYRPICCDAVKELDPASIQWPKPNWPPREMAELSVSVITPEILLADTGSSMIACPTAEDRLLCYLPPACVIIARTDQLYEHLPAAWQTVAPRCADTKPKRRIRHHHRPQPNLRHRKNPNPRRARAETACGDFGGMIYIHVNNAICVQNRPL